MKVLQEEARGQRQSNAAPPKKAKFLVTFGNITNGGEYSQDEFDEWAECLLTILIYKRSAESSRSLLIESRSTRVRRGWLCSPIFIPGHLMRLWLHSMHAYHPSAPSRHIKKGRVAF